MKDKICNLCGESCWLGRQKGKRRGKAPTELGGLIDATAIGGYDSTPGNGRGALDDGMSYRFSLCEFCLDWLFQQFRAPPIVEDLMSARDDLLAWRPARVRVVEDDWRKKEEFFTESERRAKLRERR